jgi:hypothetical protein
MHDNSMAVIGPRWMERFPCVPWLLAEDRIAAILLRSSFGLRDNLNAPQLWEPAGGKHRG